MNKEELKQALDKEGVDPHYYSLNGLENGQGVYDDMVILDKEGREWLVYYYERGDRWDMNTFDTEDEACKYLFQWVTRDPNTRIWSEPKI